MNNIKDLKFDDKNFNDHTEFGMSLLEKSLQDYGAGRSILIDKNNNIIAGNGIVEAAAQAGIENVRIIETQGDEPMEKQHMDILEMAEVLTDPAPIPVVEQLKEVGTEHLDILEEEKPKPKKKTRYGSASATPGAESSTNGWCLLAKGEENENN